MYVKKCYLCACEGEGKKRIEYKGRKRLCRSAYGWGYMGSNKTKNKNLLNSATEDTRTQEKKEHWILCRRGVGMFQRGKYHMKKGKRRGWDAEELHLGTVIGSGCVYN